MSENVNVSSSTFNSTKWNDRAVWVLAILSTLFCGFSIISNIIATKVVALPFGLYVPGASIVFPLVGISADLISNLYGSKTMKKITTLGIIGNLLLALFCVMVVAWPTPVWNDATAMNTTLAQSFRMVVVGVISLYLTQGINAIILQKIKKKQVKKGEDILNRKGIYTRAYISSIPSVFLDAFLFVTGSFLGIMPIATIIQMFLTQAILKLVVEAILQVPISSFLIPKVSRYTEYDITEEATASLNPLRA